MCPKDRKTPIPKTGDHLYIHQQSDGSNAITHVESEYKFAFELRKAARVMANAAKEMQDDGGSELQLKAHVYGAIILSYASLEAALNEIMHIHSLTANSPLNESEKNIIFSITHGDLVPRKNNHTLHNFNMLLRIIGKHELNSGMRIYQHADLVRALRNEIVHPIPGRVVTYVASEDYDYASQQDIVRKLRGALKLKKTATFPKDIITAECALWAVSSCEEFLHAFVIRSGIDVGFITDQK